MAHKSPGAAAPTSPTSAAAPIALPLNTLAEITDQIDTLRECQQAVCALAELVLCRESREALILNTVDRRGLGHLLDCLAKELDFSIAGAKGLLNGLWARAHADAPAGE